MESKDYQTVFDQSSVVMVIVNANYTIEAASEGFLKATLNERENITGRKFFDVFPKIGEKIEQILINSMRDSFDKVIKEKKIDTTPVVRFDIPNSREDGFIIRYWKVINTPIFDDKNDVKYIKQIYVDVTDSKKLSMQLELEKENLDEYKTAEEYIRNSFKQAPVPVCVFRGPSHLFEMTNDVFRRITNIRNYIGKPVREVLPELGGQGFFEILDEVYKTEKPYVSSEVPIIFSGNGQSKEDIYIEFFCQILTDARGNKEGVFVLGLDVTNMVNTRNKLEERTEELKHNNKLLIKRNNEIEQKNKDLEVFTYISSHDLQEPLRKIRLFAGRIVDKDYQNISDDGLRYFELMQDASKRMKILIEDLLTFSKFKSDGQKFEKVDLTHLIKEVRSDHDEFIKEKNATVEVTDTCRVSIIVYQFRQLMSNLISNSLKYSKPDTPPHIIINGKCLTGDELIKEKRSKLKDKLNPEKKYCYIRIEDNGIGFNPEYGDHIFEVFKRLHSTDEYEGTGIGLAIAKKVVENHKGVITAKGKPGKGALFEIYLPVEHQ